MYTYSYVYIYVRIYIYSCTNTPLKFKLTTDCECIPRSQIEYKAKCRGNQKKKMYILPLKFKLTNRPTLGLYTRKSSL